MARETLCARIAALGLTVLALTCSTGCPVVSNLPAPGQVLDQREPETDRKYYLYVPTRRPENHLRPLVVTCHGTRPWDSAEAQLREWKGLAERHGFLLAAPVLIGTASGIPVKVDQQLRRQLDDERAILSLVRSVRGAYPVDESRVFLFGWSAGAYAVVFTGLRNPDVFRALSVRQGNFDPRYVDLCVPFLDRYQPIQVIYGVWDPIDNSRALIDWLHSHDLEPASIQRPGTHRRDQEPVYAFFADVVKSRPWIRIHVQDHPTDDMRLTFSFSASFRASKCLWDFGDQQRSEETQPEHRYALPNVYTVRLALWPEGDKPRVRSVQLQVPRIRLGAAPASAPAGTPSPPS